MLDPEIIHLVVCEIRFYFGAPAVGILLPCKLFVNKRVLFRILFLSSVGGEHDQPRTLTNIRRIVDSIRIGGLLAGHVQHRLALVEAEVDGNTKVGAGVCERAMQDLTIADNDIPWIADQRHGIVQAFRPRLLKPGFDIYFA